MLVHRGVRTTEQPDKSPLRCAKSRRKLAALIASLQLDEEQQFAVKYEIAAVMRMGLDLLLDQAGSTPQRLAGMYHKQLSPRLRNQGTGCE